jgi:hypothetical protein
MSELSNFLIAKFQNEKLRQVKETFEQRKSHERLWFKLRLFIGYASIIMIIGVFALSFYILYYSSQFSTTIIYLAGAALFVDMVALVATVWKMVLSPKFITELNPFIKELDQ